MTHPAQVNASELDVGALALDDIPAVVVVLQPDDQSVANQAFFDLPGLSEDGVVSTQAPWDLVRQLVAIRDGESSAALVTVDSGRSLTLRVLSWKRVEKSGASVFSLALEQVPDVAREARGSGKTQGTAEEILNTLPLAVFVHDAGTLLFANPALARLGGFPNVQTLMDADLNVFDFFPRGKEMREYWVRRSRGLSVPSTYETELVTLDGRRRIVRVNANIMDWYGRNVVIGSLTDITEARLAERELADSEARFRDYANTAANWFWETDVEDRYIRLSDGVEEITGTPVKDVLGLKRSEVFSLCDGEYLDDPREFAQQIEFRHAFRDFKYTLTVPDGRRLSFAISGVPVFDDHGVFTGYRGTSRDITEERELQEAINYVAAHDDLTGLFNRRTLVEKVEDAISNAVSRSGEDESEQYDFLCYIDLDGLKVINDTVGHGFGDELLKQCSTILKRGVRDGDVVARLGGDEFGILLRRITKERAVMSIERLLHQVSAYKFHREGRTFNVGFSAGLICIDGRIASSEDLFAFADLSCYTAKERGKGQVCVYETSDDVVEQRRVEMHTASRIESAIDNEHLVIHAQPIVSLRTNHDRPEHYELLVRMLAEDGSLIPPGAFIGAAERYNLAPRIDRYVLHNAFVKLAPYVGHQEGAAPQVTINLSGETLGDPTFATFVMDEFSAFPQIDPSRVCFEVTETAAIRNLDVATEFIRQMRRIGCSFALDDFGTGLSSFSYLKDLEVDYLKIDGVFVGDIVHDNINRAVVASICEIARSLDRKVVAECVEDPKAVNMLTALGVDYGQGFVWARPRPLVDILAEGDVASGPTETDATPANSTDSTESEKIAD